MKMVIGLLLILMIQTLYGFGIDFKLQCPFYSQWDLRAKAMCNVSERYHCLTDANKIKNIEACRNGPQFDAPGYKIQIVGSLEGVHCANDRYQPFIFWTNGSNLCKIEKSLCHGEGEVRVSLGTTTEDRTCRCDYTKGYDFVIKPRNLCSCMPSEEDCSCFIRQCPRGFVLSPDYECAPPVQKMLEKSRCPFISNVDNTQPSSLPQDEGDNHHDYQNVLVRGRSRIQKIVVSIAVVLLVFLIIGMGFFLVFSLGPHTSVRKIWSDSLINFVPNRASEEMLLSIEENPFILMTGPFGTGKTTIVNYITSKLTKEGYEIIDASEPEEIVRHFRRNQRQLYIFDDEFGKYSSNISYITDRWTKYCSKINEVLTKSNSVKIIITCRTYIFLQNKKCFENLRTNLSFVHKDLTGKILLNLEERRNIYRSYFKSNPPESISDEILSLYHFYPVMSSSYNTDNFIQHLKYPVDTISAEIAGMQKVSDFSYLALAILVVMNNKVEISKLSGSSYSEKTDVILLDIFHESGFNQYPSKSMLRLTFMSLKGEFISDDGTFFSFLSPELFDVVAICIGGSFIQSILKHSSSVFIKEKLGLYQTQGNDCPHTIQVQNCMEDKFYQRLASDMNNNLIVDVLSNKIFQNQTNRRTFVGYLGNHVKSEKLIDATTGSNVLHVISSLGYLDFLTDFLIESKCPGVNKTNSRGETPLHLACQNGHYRCVEFLIKCEPAIDETDLNQRTALHYACEFGHENIVKCLITNGAEINQRDVKGLTPLHLACSKGYYGVIKCLVENNANINEADRNHRTPLHYASEHRSCNVVNILILNKASVNISDNQGYTPLHIACEYENEEVIKLLVKYEAVTNSKSKQELL